MNSRLLELSKTSKTSIVLVPMNLCTHKLILYVQTGKVALPLEYVFHHTYTEVSLFTPEMEYEHYFFDVPEMEYVQASPELLDVWYTGVPEKVRKTCAYLINLYRTNLYQYLSFIKTVEKLGQININVR